MPCREKENLFMEKKTLNPQVQNLALAAMCMAVGLVLPFFTGQIPQIGSMLLPMHIPVLLCGLICGWQYGAAVGFVVPLLRSVLFGMPPLFPTALVFPVVLLAVLWPLGLTGLWINFPATSALAAVLAVVILRRQHSQLHRPDAS